jgi:hypothetical protein
MRSASRRRRVIATPSNPETHSGVVFSYLGVCLCKIGRTDSLSARTAEVEGGNSMQAEERFALLKSSATMVQRAGLPYKVRKYRLVRFQPIFLA